MGEPLREPDGKIIQWYGLTIDIDERKKADERGFREVRCSCSRYGAGRLDGMPTARQLAFLNTAASVVSNRPSPKCVAD